MTTGKLYLVLVLILRTGCECGIHLPGSGLLLRWLRTMRITRSPKLCTLSRLSSYCMCETLLAGRTGRWSTSTSVTTCRGDKAALACNRHCRRVHTCNHLPRRQSRAGLQQTLSSCSYMQPPAEETKPRWPATNTVVEFVHWIKLDRLYFPELHASRNVIIPHPLLD